MSDPAFGYEKFQSIRVFTALDGLRALSVIAVIWQHTSGWPGPEIFHKGYFGVDLFFAISGFLITTLLLREYSRNGRFSLPKFYLRRSFRIFPLYYAVLAMYIVLVHVVQHGTTQGKQFLHHLPSFLTYTSNWYLGKTNGNSVTFYFAWSLATEEQFYAFWPPLLALLLLLPGRPLMKAITALGILIVVSQSALAEGATSSLPITILASFALPILLGAGLAVALHDRRGFALLWRIFSPWLAAPICLILVLASLVVTTPEQLTQALMVCLVGCLCIRERTPLHPPLAWHPLAYIGKVSYAIYLMHMLCANAIRPILGRHVGILLFILTTALAIGVASISYRCFEKPLLRLGHRWGAPRRPSTLARHTADHRADSGRPPSASMSSAPATRL